MVSFDALKSATASVPINTDIFRYDTQAENIQMSASIVITKTLQKENKNEK